jgi:uncharacterized repeat protein (TIGR01451 family)
VPDGANPRENLRKLRISPRLWAAVAAIVGVLCRPAAQAQEPADVLTELVAEVRENISTTPGRELFRFVPARMLEQGQVVYYTLRITNQTTVPLRNVAVVQPVPANTIYLADSASGPGAAVSFSVDGGLSFAPAQSLTVETDGLKRPAQVSQYTHIRWQLGNALAPGATALARFRATFR